jgi:hypothetical protein
MNKQQAIDLVKETFESPFEKGQFANFIGNLLNEYERDEFTYTGKYIPDSYKDYVTKYERLGKYEDSEEKRIDILIINLKRKDTIERARSMQRNFVAGYLQGKYGTDADKDAALVAFVSPNGEDWRFSLVKLEVRLEATDKGGMKVLDEFTPAKRWSFLVGSHEKSHTAQTQFVPIMQDTDNNPTLAKLEDAFNIEKVTKEFFEKYRELFMRTREALDKAVKANPATKSDFERKGINTVDLAKKLLGQIIFLYYLQKKGWFGVPKELKWGDGSKTFLRELYTKSQNEKKNFFNDILEPLFYEALRIDRSHDDHYYKLFDCKIPFLNGGLFDPMNNYDWVKTEILLPNALFSNKKKVASGSALATTSYDDGDGILDVFDLYNFTVKEDEPFEKEVAIDPELLGKAYEKFNAIRPDNYDEFLKALKSGKKGEESKFNKQYGVYYTPREIVHYMCQQSLINYLYSELNPNVVYQSLGDDQLDMFGNAAKGGQMDMSVEHHPMAEIAKEEIALLIQHGEKWRENEERVETTGRETDAYSYKTPESIRENAALIDEKLAAIKVCDPAVGSGAFPVGMMSEIVRARDVLKTWTKSKKTVYDFKRECIENSLYGVDIDAGAVEIAKLRLWLSLIVDEEDIQNIKPLPNLDYKIVCGNSLVGFPDNWGSSIEKEIESLIHQHFNETSPTKKDKLKTQIDEKIQTRYKNSLKTFGYQVSFDFRMIFSEVFQQKGGFDVVIGNPPYVNAKTMQKDNPKERVFLKNSYKLLTDKWDLYLAFIEKAMNISGRASVVTMIIPNAFVKENYSKKMREYLISNRLVRSVVFYEYDIFEAAVRNIVLVIQKPTALETEQLIYQDPTTYLNNKVVIDNIFKSTDFLLARLLSSEKNLGDVCFISVAMVLNSDESLEKGKFIKDDLISDTKDKIHCKRYTEGKWIDKYQIKTIKYLEWGTKRVPSKIRRKTFPELYEMDKILVNKLGNIKATYDDSKIYCDQTIRVLVKYTDLKGIENKSINSSIQRFSEKDRGLLENISKGYQLKFVLALLNTTLYNYLLGILRTKESIDLNPLILRKLPIPNISLDSQKPFEKLVDRILAAKRANPQADTSTWEGEIDQLVYQLYGLTEDEVKIVEGKK